MARLQAVVLALALSSVAATDEDRSVIDGKWGCEKLSTQDACCKALDGRDGMTDHKCVPTKSGTFSTGNTCEPACLVDGSKSCGGILADSGTDEKDNMYVCYPVSTEAPPAPTPAPTTVTTTMTPWDSSASSSADQTSLDSSYSSSFKEDSDSSASSADNSADSSGSTASGSSGSYMPLWMWGIAAALASILCCAAMASLMKPKPKKKKPTPKPQPPPPVEEDVPELAPLVPVTTSYVQQPVMQQPVMTYAQPMPMTYAQPYAAPGGYVV